MTTTVKNQNRMSDIPEGILTIEEIRDIVGNGWAIIKVAERDGITTKGELLDYSSDEEEALDKLGVLGRKHRVLFKYCGKRDPNIVYLL